MREERWEDFDGDEEKEEREEGTDEDVGRQPYWGGSIKCHLRICRVCKDRRCHHKPRTNTESTTGCFMHPWHISCRVEHEKRVGLCIEDPFIQWYWVPVNEQQIEIFQPVVV